MVKTLHDNDISVVMDVVYNHVYNAGEFCFNVIVPEYFSRVNDNGTYSNGSGCGNDTASERSMVKKYIVDSVKYWTDEYHIDGFRFDLVGLLDTETMNEVIEEVHKDHPDVIFYGEGWSMQTSLTKEGYSMTTQTNSTEVPEMSCRVSNEVSWKWRTVLLSIRRMETISIRRISPPLNSGTPYIFSHLRNRAGSRKY